MIALDTPVLIDLLSGSARADVVEGALREALAAGPVVVCDVALAELCAALQGGDLALQTLEEMGIGYSALQAKAAVRAGEMQRRSRGHPADAARSAADFLIGAHALMQCSALITHDDAFFHTYFKGLKLIVPRAG